MEAKDVSSFIGMVSSVKWVFAVVAYIYAPIIVGILNGGYLSVEGVVMSWVIPAMLALAYAEIRFIDKYAA